MLPTLTDSRARPLAMAVETLGRTRTFDARRLPMGIAITFRHMDSTEALKTYVHEKLERIQRNLRTPIDAHVTLYQERHQFVAEMNVQASRQVYQAKHDSDDMYKSIDFVIDKVEHQIAKVHDANSRNKKGGQKAAEVGARATNPGPEPEEG